MPEVSTYFLDRLEQAVSAASIKISAEDQSRYWNDWRDRHHGRSQCTVLPRDAREVAAVLALCNEERVPVFPQGGNTSVSGGSVPSADGRGVVLSLERLNKIREVNAANYSITVEAGCILAQIQEAARPVNRFFPLSLGAEGSCQIGGNIATNAGGTSVVRYGNTRDLVLGLEVVLPDGRIWTGLRTLRKDNSGYDLKNLFAGSEGTLGVITAAALKLFPLLPNTVTALFALDDIGATVALGSRIQEIFSSELVALELMSRSETEIVLRHVPGAVCPLEHKGQWQLIVELTSSAPESVLIEQLNAMLEQEIESGIVLDAVIATSGAQRDKIWHLRHHTIDGNKREGMGLTHDIAVPVYRLPEFITKSRDVLARSYPGTEVVIIGHIGDGNLHYVVMHSHPMWAALPEKEAYKQRLACDIYDIVASMGGTFSAEHGIGAIHLDEMAKYKNPVELALMWQVKRTLDPNGIMNPGRLLPQLHTQ